jgi:large subunit ribosomal protein L24
MSKHSIKTGEEVKILTGKDKGKTGKVMQVFPKLARVAVQGINLRKRHIRSRRAGDVGQIVEFSMPIHISNVQRIEGGEQKETKESAKPKAQARKK